MAKKKIDLKKDNIALNKAIGMLSISPRDSKAMGMVYKFYKKEHTLKVWLVRFEKDGFNIKNLEELRKLIK